MRFSSNELNRIFYILDAPITPSYMDSGNRLQEQKSP